MNDLKEKPIDEVIEKLERLHEVLREIVKLIDYMSVMKEKDTSEYFSSSLAKALEELLAMEKEKE